MSESTSIEQFKKFKAELALAETWNEIKNIESKAAAVAEFAKKNKEAKILQDECGIFRVEIEQKKGAWLEGNFPHGGQKYAKASYDNNNSLDKMSNHGVTSVESSNARLTYNEAEWTKEIIQNIRQNKNKVVTPNLISSEIRKKKKEQRINEEREKYKEKAKNFKEEDIKVRNLDFRDKKLKLEDNSIDLILTDPPYPKEDLKKWYDLFKIGKRVLKENAFLVAYSGQMNLDTIFSYASEHELDYYWMMSIDFTTKPLISGRNVLNMWKPILIFQNGKKKLDRTFSDKIKVELTERELHDKNWGQVLEPFEYLVETFSDVNDLIFEPFMGSGTTLLACKNKGRRAIGCEIDSELCEISKGRLI